jgi:hypothetical protein
MVPLNPFLFIRGLSCSRSVQTSLTQHCLSLTTVYLDFLTTSFVNLVVTLALLKNPRSRIGLEIRPQSACTALMALLPSINGNDIETKAERSFDLGFVFDIEVKQTCLFQNW